MRKYEKCFASALNNLHNWNVKYLLDLYFFRLSAGKVSKYDISFPNIIYAQYNFRLLLFPFA